MGTVGDALDNAVAESFFASPQCELLDRHTWPNRAGLARAMFHYVEAFYNPTRRHSTLGYLSPIDYETAHAAKSTPNNHHPGNGVNSIDNHALNTINPTASNRRWLTANKGSNWNTEWNVMGISSIYLMENILPTTR